ncbi:helix-turn-helix transcriptional regulator [Vallitalea okinawensis]|uniref:helix-turn-helix transcriptional regulator n=1 Tax=Vallitalea okinawensis TaxID=2078660 RepID=UPI000CFDF08B|nr:AraC family transcriptional regulator [Vallitalea okinawensis]
MAIYEALKESIRFIESNLEKNIGVKDVADVVSYSQFYLSREFSRVTHISIYDYIIRRKICESYRYLIATQSKIVDVAFKYGFNSHEVYSRAFKKVFGMNPSQIRVDDYLAYYDAIDDHYFDFLYHLNWELVDEGVTSCYFDGIPTRALEYRNALIVLSKDHTYEQFRLQGNLVAVKDTHLVYELKDMVHRIRVYSTNTDFAYRFFVDNYLDRNDLTSNYILLKKENKYIDIIVPTLNPRSSH